MAFLYIDRIGVEIEGGWPSSPENYTHDGSVSRSIGAVSGETVSPPYKRLSALHGYIETNWPVNVDETCGYHIHMSFIDNAMYSRLMEQDFHTQSLEFWKRWATDKGVRPSHRFWKRVDGDNEYCKVSAEIPTQIQADSTSKGRERYYFLNFCHGFHKTMELRLLPAWKDKEMGVDSLNAWIGFVESFLRANEIGYSLKEDLSAEKGLPIEVCENITVTEKMRAARGWRDFKVGDKVIAHGRVQDRVFEVPTNGVIIGVNPRSSSGYEIRARYMGVGEWCIWGEDNAVLTLERCGEDRLCGEDRFRIGDTVRTRGRCSLDGMEFTGRETGEVEEWTPEDSNDGTVNISWERNDGRTIAWSTWGEELDRIEVTERV